MDNFNCECDALSFWNDIAAACVPCSSVIKNLNGEAASGYSCKCLPGFSWDVLSFSCITNICNLKTDSKCGNCSLVLSPTAAKLVAIGSTFITLSDGALFAGKVSVNASNPIYNNVKEYKCACPTGTLWERSRKRCYPSAAVY